MKTISGIPYIEAQFDAKGVLQNAVEIQLPAGVSDLLVVSHGWNNTANDARDLYQKLFANFVAVARPGDLPGRTFAILGVIWPSKKFDDLVAASSSTAGGAAGVNSGESASIAQLEEKLDQLKELFTEPAQQQSLEEIKALIPELEDKGSARRELVNKIRSLLDPTAADPEDASPAFFHEDGNELMVRLKVDLEDEDGDGSGEASPILTRDGVSNLGGAAGIKGFLSGFKAAAFNILNYSTYFEMKTRAGTVGTHGVAKLVDQLSPSVARIHLIGHSFGGRVVTAAVANSSSTRIRSLSLLQTAFSHNGFSKTRKGFFRSVVDRQRVSGPVLVTHTPNDKAVGMAYPIASRINGDSTAALGDENDKFGGLGRNGAQQMESGEVVKGKLLAATGTYQFTGGKFFNLEGSSFIADHGSVFGKEIAHAVRCAVGS
jgi:hypothetical protein